MRRGWSFFIALAAVLALLLLPAQARTADGAIEDEWTDHLNSMDDVKWYSFDMAEAGDLHVTVHGLQEYWDGWNSLWYFTVYAPDGETVLAQEAARGFNADYSPPTEFSLLDLEGGTYYIRVTNAAANHFTTDPYRLELERTYRSQQSFVSAGDGSYVMGDESFQDRLTDPEQERWYAFEMEEPGDAVVSAAGLQEQWDGFTYHWQCAVYGVDRETVLACADVRGYSEAEGPAFLSAPDLEAGTYYVRMTRAGSSNPFMAGFTTDPYQLRLYRYYPAASGGSGGEEGDIQTFRAAGDILWSFDGTAFIKLNDGECRVALMQNKSGAVVPILIGTEETAVEYVVSSTGKKVTAQGPWTHRDSDTQYWYSDSGIVKSYSDRSPSTASLPMLFIDSRDALTAAKAMVDKLLQDEMGAWSYWWFKHGQAVGLGAGALALIVVAIVLAKLFGGGGDGGGSSGGGGDGEPDSTGSIDEAITSYWADKM